MPDSWSIFWTAGFFCEGIHIKYQFLNLLKVIVVVFQLKEAPHLFWFYLYHPDRKNLLFDSSNLFLYFNKEKKRWLIIKKLSNDNQLKQQIKNKYNKQKSNNTLSQLVSVDLIVPAAFSSSSIKEPSFFDLLNIINIRFNKNKKKKRMRTKNNIM